jgi:hypothetical protein
VQSADEGFEFLDPSSAPAVPAEPPDEVSAFTEAPVEPSEPLPFESLAPPEPPMEPPLESFESAESAEEFVPAEEPEAPAGLPQVAESLGNEVPRVISPAEPPIEFEEPGPGAGSPEMPGIAPVDGQIPDFDAWSNPPGSEVVAPGGLESTSDAESIAPLGFGGPQDEGPVAPPEVPIWGGAPADSESDVQGIPSSGFEVQDLAESSGDLEAQGQEPSALDFESNPWEDSTGETQTASFVPDAPSRKRKAKKGWWPFGKGK